MPANDHPNLIHRYSRLLRPLVIHYLETLSSSEDANFDREQIPHQPRSIAQIASILLQADSLQKQQLLAMTSLTRLLRALIEIYRLETLLLRVRLSPPGREFNIGPFSSN